MKLHRPYNSYNIFFTLERTMLVEVRRGLQADAAHIVEGSPSSPPTRALPSAHSAAPTGYELIDLPPLPPRYRHLESILPLNWYVPGKNKIVKRKHSKTHGLASFQEVARTVAANWKAIDPVTKEYAEDVARILKERHCEIKSSLGQDRQEEDKNEKKRTAPSLPKPKQSRQKMPVPESSTLSITKGIVNVCPSTTARSLGQGRQEDKNEKKRATPGPQQQPGQPRQTMPVGAEPSPLSIMKKFAKVAPNATQALNLAGDLSFEPIPILSEGAANIPHRDFVPEKVILNSEWQRMIARPTASPFRSLSLVGDCHFKPSAPGSRPNILGGASTPERGAFPNNPPQNNDWFGMNCEEVASPEALSNALGLSLTVGEVFSGGHWQRDDRLSAHCHGAARDRVPIVHDAESIILSNYWRQENDRRLSTFRQVDMSDQEIIDDFLSG